MQMIRKEAESLKNLHNLIVSSQNTHLLTASQVRVSKEKSEISQI